MFSPIDAKQIAMNVMTENKEIQSVISSLVPGVESCKPMKDEDKMKEFVVLKLE